MLGGGGSLDVYIDHMCQQSSVLTCIKSEEGQYRQAETVRPVRKFITFVNAQLRFFYINIVIPIKYILHNACRPVFVVAHHGFVFLYAHLWYIKSSSLIHSWILPHLTQKVTQVFYFIFQHIPKPTNTAHLAPLREKLNSPTMSRSIKSNRRIRSRICKYEKIFI